MSRPSIQLIAADLDGTLLNDDKSISEPTVQAIQQLGKRGIRFVIASARPPRSVRHIYRQLGLDTLQVNYNGALIWDEPQRHAIEHFPLPGDLTLQMIRFARAMDSGILITCEILDRWHTDRLDNTFTTATGKLFSPDVIAPPETYCSGPITKLLLLGPQQTVSVLRPRLLQTFGQHITVVSTDPDMLQIMSQGVSKAAALRRLVRHYKVPLSDVLAIGDGENDLEMLRECGVGVAVANAAPTVKAAAQWVAPSSNSHGVLEALRHFLP